MIKDKKNVMDSYDGESVVRTQLLPSKNGGCATINKQSCKIDEGLPSQLDCTAYVGNLWRKILCFLFFLCTGGFGLLLFYWRPDWWLRCSSHRTKISSASHLLLETSDDSKQKFVVKMRHMSTKQAKLMERAYSKLSSKKNKDRVAQNQNEDGGSTLYFIHQSLRFIWNFDSETFVELGGLDKRASIRQIFADSARGLNSYENEERLAVFGPNLISVVVPHWLKLLITGILNPFYVFQLFSCILWYLDQYEIYATTIVVSSVISALISLYEVRSSLVNLHNMVEYHNMTKTPVLRIGSDGEEVLDEVWSKDLVPGDVIVIPASGIELACDAALVSGVCIVNESMLTGESVPITKTPLPTGDSHQSQIFSTQLHKRHTLFCGTKVLQTRYYAGERVKAVVVGTGYSTAKGRLIHSILYPKPLNMQLMRDAYRFIAVLCGIAACGFVYSLVIMHINGETAEEIVLRALDIITVVVPPAMPVAMTVGIVYAQRRLKRHNINCISSERINLSGQVDVVAFDKTGTLTEDGLDIYELVPAHRPPGVEQSSFDKTVPRSDIRLRLDGADHMLRALASCHTLTNIEGELRGDPLDVILFEATGWRMVEPEDGEESQFDKIQCTYVTPASGGNGSAPELGIVRCFTFESALQRSSVLVRPSSTAPRDMMVYLKGSPEMVASLCRPGTLPDDYHSLLKLYTQQGYRMIAMAHKPIKLSWLKAQKVEREVVEKDLEFLGFIALQNKLKPESKSGLKKLKDADIRSLMVTGDNLLTALSVAQDSGMIGLLDDVILAQTRLPQDYDDVDKPTLTFVYAEGYSTLKNGDGEDAFGEANEASGKTKQQQQESLPSSLNKRHSAPLENLEKGFHRKNWHLAVTGYDFANIKNFFPEWMETLAVKGSIFARMSPDQKTELVEELDKIGHHVCMCGDGANDCGALKRAHVGISLSEYEASVAAPFTSSLEHGIECVPLLIREGRAALVTSFGMFKFMALYSLIQFITITVLYSYGTLLSDVGFMYIDLVVIEIVALTMSRNYPCKKLYRQKPPSSLMSAEMMTSLMYNFLLQAVLQIVAVFYLTSKCWYNGLPIAEASEAAFYNLSTCGRNFTYFDQTNVEDEYDVMQYTTSYLLLVSVFFYLTTSVTFSQSHPFRTRIYKNKLYFCSLLLLYAFNLFVSLAPPLPLINFMQVRWLPEPALRYSIVVFGAAHFILSTAFESLVVENPSWWRWLRRNTCPNRRLRFELVRQSLDGSGNARRGLAAANAADDVGAPDPTKRINARIESQLCMVDVSESVGSVQAVGDSQCISTNFSSDKSER